MSIKQFTVVCKYIRPRTSEEYTEIFGPVFGIKAVNLMAQTAIKKRNCIGVAIQEVTPTKTK